MNKLFLRAGAAALLLAATNATAAPPPPPCDPIVVFFAPGSATLADTSQMVVAEMARIAQENRNRVEVEGYVDIDEADPRGLARRRAEAARDQLVQDGVAGDRIAIIDMGTRVTMTPNPRNVMEHDLNRRAQMSACPD